MNRLILLIEVFLTANFSAWACQSRAYFECHAHFTLRFKRSCGLGEPWTMDGSKPHGGPLSTICVVSLSFTWCNSVHALDCVQLQLHADNFKCVTQESDQLLRTARFTTIYFQVVGQQLGPSKCMLLSAGRATRSEMRSWIILDEVKMVGCTGHGRSC